MRQRLATILGSTLLIFGGGCSLLYNPNNLPAAPSEAGPIDAAIDGPPIITDVNSDALEVISTDLTVLTEGTGDGGSPVNLLVVNGHQFVAGAQVTITPYDMVTDISAIHVDNTKLVIADTANELVVPVKFDVDPLHDGTAGAVRVLVTVTQPGSAGMVSKSTPDNFTLELHYLPELIDTNLPATFTTGLHEYSKVDLSVPIVAPTTASEPIIIRATASVSITANINVNATGKPPGPGGFAGGKGATSAALNAVPGDVGGGTGGGRSSGGGGGFGTVGAGANGGMAVGDPQLSTLGAPNRGCGGAGGSSAALGPNGTDGGGGGGSIEITAGGDLHVADVTSKGGNGTNGGGANSGGGGSGGAILLRGFTATVGSITAPGGTAGTVTTGTIGSDGGLGRVRIDSTNLTSSAPIFRGPMFKGDTVRVVREGKPTLNFVSEKSKPFNFVFSNATGNMTHTGVVSAGSAGNTQYVLTENLFFGTNHFCLIVDGADSGSEPEAKNCLDIVYLFDKAHP